jgi:hypothetical protein
VNRSQLVTERCIGGAGQPGCDRWLVKYDPATKRIVEVAKRIKSAPLAHWSIIEGNDFEGPGPGWEYVPSMKSLVDTGVMIDPDLIPPEDVHGYRRLPDYYRVRCQCGRWYKLTL